MMNLDVYHSLIFGGTMMNSKHHLDDRDSWGSDYFHVAAVLAPSDMEAAIGGGDQLGIDEDDILYAELSRQVLLLTADDDEEDDVITFGEEALRRRRFDDGNGYASGNFMMNMKRSASVNSNESYSNAWSNFGSAAADFTGGGMNHHQYFNNLWEKTSDQYGNLPGGGAGGWQGNSSSWGSGPVNMTGTGVFIPHVANSKRRHRRGKKNGKKRAASSKQAGGEIKQ